MGQRNFVKLQGQLWVSEKALLGEVYSQPDEVKSLAEAQERLAENEELACDISQEGVELELEYDRLNSKLQQLRDDKAAKLKLQADLRRQISERTGEDHDLYKYSYDTW